MVPPGNIFVLIAIYAWLPLALYLYNRYEKQRAVVLIFVISILFLPCAFVKFPLIPPYGKTSAAPYAVLIATAIYDSDRFSAFKFSWIDIPIVLWAVVSPFISSMTNDLGIQDAISQVLTQSINWGGPYFVGRLYLGNLEGLKKLAIGIFAWGLIYVPFCFYEGRTFSSLHVLIYGMDTGRDAAQSMRYGGYRPQVFMEHGLMLGVWLMTGCLVGVALWRTGGLKRMWNKPMGMLMGILLFTFVAARSTGAYGLFVMGAVILFVAWQFRNTLILWAIILGICYYLYSGATGTFPNKPIVESLSQVFNADRVASLAFRFDNEEILGEKARQRMLFGWGGFGRNRIVDEEGKDVAVTDSLWIIAFGINGVFGLFAMTASILGPPVAFLIRYPAKLWKNPNFAPAAALSVCIVLYMLDCVLNAMINPIFMLAGGGIAGVVLQPMRVTKSQMQPAPSRRRLIKATS